MKPLSKRVLLAPLIAMLLATPAVTGWADPPSIMSMFRKKQPFSEGALELKDHHGPWMILATTLAGEDSLEQATALAKELRTTLGLPCYIMQRQAGGPQTLATREREKTDAFGRTRRYQLELKYANGASTTAFAILVGEFNSTDDPRIKDALQSVRTVKPGSLADEAEVTEENIEDPNWLVQKTRSFLWSRTDRASNLQKGPLGAAFVTRNPLLPDDFFQAPPVDKFVESLNREKWINFSLLDCPGRFTVRVASFRGNEVTDFGNGARASKMDETSNALDKGAEKAHRLTEALRAKGKEAFEFHDRFGSYVTVGSFDSLGEERNSGQFQPNPAISAVLEEFCGYRVVDAKDPRTGAMSKRTSLKSEGKIPFDIEGKPMAVPRPETSGLYGGSLLGNR